MGKLPKSWSDVTIPQLMELEAIDNDHSIDSELFPEIMRGIYKLGVFTKLPAEYYEEMTQKKIIEEIRKIDFLKQYPSEKAVTTFKCGGYKWKVQHKVQSLKGKDIVSHHVLTEDPKSILKNCHRLMSIYCTPYKWGRKLKMEDDEKAKLLLSAPVQVIYPLTVFFCKTFPLYLDATKDYLQQTIQKAEKELAQA